jgi:serine protease AprX
MRSKRRWTAAALTSLFATSGLAISAGGVGAAVPPTGVHSVKVFAPGRYIVQGASSKTISALGGHVLQRLPIVHGVVAQLSKHEATALGNDPAVTLTVDARISLAGAATPSAALPATTTSTPASTGGSTSYRTATKASTLPASVDGTGVTVAVIDTGIDAALPDFGGRVIGGVDLTGGGSPYTDGYGHGTFVAGLIASNGASSGGAYLGEAPGANLVSIKVANDQGATTEGTVIQGIAWAAAHHNGPLGIDVINLSLGVKPTTPAELDPLDQAVEYAWNLGIVVVVSAGNFGPNNGSITSPGDDPLVITVGALDDGGCVVTSPCVLDPMKAAIPSFSSVGPTAYDGIYKPDLVASGRSVVSLAVPGSVIATENPSAITGPNGTNFVGSGTSFSSAITAGAVALLLETHPGLTPDEVKATLLATTDPGPTGDPFVDGHGALDIATAVTTPTHFNLDQRISAFAELHWVSIGTGISLPQTWAFSTWDPQLWVIQGSTSRFVGAAWGGAAWNGAAWNGSAWNSALLNVILNGAAWNDASWQLIFNGAPWNGAAWNTYFTGAAWNGAAWNGAAWNGAAWNGAAWNGAAWNGAAWNGAAWNNYFSGAAWNGAAWNGAAWNGAAWNGAAWNGAAWNGAAWNGAAWNGAAWNGAAWNGAAWNGAAWNGAAWNGAAWNGAAWNGAAWNGDAYT